MGDAEVIQLDTRARAASSSTAARKQAGRDRCRATTSTGRPCRNNAVDGNDYCRVHGGETSSAEAVPTQSPPVEASNRIEGFIDWLGDFARRRLSGQYPIDDFGYDPELAREVLVPLMQPLYEHYFRVRTLWVDRIPADGPALLVGNHSGTVALDAVMMQHSVATEHPQRRTVRNIGANLVFGLPVLGPLARKAGNAVACDEDAYELLRRGELVGVFPEGFKGVGKGWSERYRLQRFGRGGFIEVALRARVPIIPVAIVGAEESYPMIANSGFLAKALGLPYFPITPTWPLLGPLGALPLPARWIIEFGEPIPMDDYREDAADDKMLVFELADSIRDTVQQMLLKNLKVRGGTFF